jgi:hypothetical protein
MSAPTSPAETRRAAFILTLWSECLGAAPPAWRGFLESADGQRHYFHSLDGLTQLLRAASGCLDRETPSYGEPA